MARLATAARVGAARTALSAFGEKGLRRAEIGQRRKSGDRARVARGLSGPPRLELLAGRLQPRQPLAQRRRRRPRSFRW